MLNITRFENSMPGGMGVLEVVGDGRWFIPLRRTELIGTIGGPLADLLLTQVFQFSEASFPQVVEALYRFPLPGDCAIKGVTVRFGDTELTTSLRDRKEAEAEYKDAMREGRQAALVTRESPDVFTLRVAGIRPDEEVRITTSYLHMGDPEGLGFSFRVPLTTPPRYVREDETRTRAGQDQPIFVLRDPQHRFSMNLICKGGHLASPTHELSYEGEKVTLRAGEVVPDRDLVITWLPPQDEQRPVVQMFVDEEDDGQFIALVTPPRSSITRIPREITLLVDHSGSMRGPKWEAADWTVERFLRTLTSEDRFNMCLFHTFTKWFNPRPVAGTTETIDRAIEFLKDSGSGGTEMEVAIHEALAQPREGEGIARHVLLITDAEVTDRARIISMVEREAEREDRRRCSVICIDSAPNSYLAKEIAKKGRGAVRFLTSDPREVDITTALDQIMDMWDAPVLTDAHVVVDGRTDRSDGTDDQGRSRVPVGDLVPGQSRWVLGRCIDGGRPSQIWLEGHDAGYEVIAAKGIGSILAAERIAALDQLLNARHLGLDPSSVLRSLGYGQDEIQRIVGGGSLSGEAPGPWDAIRTLLVSESIRSGMICTETAFVAVRRERGKVVGGTVIVPNALPHGWDERFVLGSSQMAFASYPTGKATLHIKGPSEGRASTSSDRPHREESMERRPPTETVRVFEGTPSWKDGKAEICGPEDWSRATWGKRKRLTGLRLSAPRGPILGPKAMLLVFIGDMSAPRLKVSARQLLSQRNRPVNLTVGENEKVRIELTDPDHESPHDLGHTIMLEVTFGS